MNWKICEVLKKRHCDIDMIEMLFSSHLRIKCRGSLLTVKKDEPRFIHPRVQALSLLICLIGFIYLIV